MRRIFLITLIIIFSKLNFLYSKPNDQVIHDALGFMLGGDNGWDGVATEYQIAVSYTHLTLPTILLV